MSEFEKHYKQLNKAQKEAVDAIDGPVMVVAGPGTGKTQILTLRIANILKKTQVGPENILALTFTEAGAKEMRRRLRDLIGTAADRVRLHTYHGFAGSIINEHDDHFPHLSRAEQLTEVQSETIIREILKKPTYKKLRPVGDPELYVSKILSAIAECKKEAWTPEMVASFALEEIERVNTDPQWLSTRGPTKGKPKAEALKRIEKCERTSIFAQVYKDYEAKKREVRKMDFDDLILETIEALRKDDILLGLLQEKFQYILIDEHQDTNDSQNLLIKLIAEFFDNPNIFVVGDDKQAIYRFQGASVENFMRFQRQWKGMKVIRLEKNYRSHQHILDATFGMIENNYAEGQFTELRTRLDSEATHPLRPVDVITAGNTQAGEEYLVSELQKIIKENSTQTTAVIVRRNRDVQRALLLLEQHGIPASAERGSDIFSDPIGMLFFSLLEFLADPSKVESLAYCVAGGLWQMDIDKRAELIRSLRSGRISDVEKSVSELAELRKELNRSGALSYLILCGHLSGIVDIARRDVVSAQIWRGIISLAQELARQNPDNATELIKYLLEYRTSAGSRNVKIAIGTANAPVRIMTAHGSKGLEFDNVFLPYAVEESWLPRGRGQYFILPRQSGEDDGLRDARRLFYVALTRARARATIISSLEEGDRHLTPLRFIDELDKKDLKLTALPAVLKKVPEKLEMRTETKRKVEAVEYAKRVLSEKGLSVTALNHFMKCPTEFFYKSILKLPEPPSVSAEKGNAMHEALATVWRLPNKTEKIIADTIKKSVTAFFETSLLPSFEKEPALESLIEDAPAVATALVSHFSTTGMVSTETRRETVFNGSYDDTSVPLLLHGKLDALVDSKEKVLIFDYKTREALSVNAIKGNTKDSDGNYFRQLVYYHMLVEGDKKLNKKSIEPALVFVKPDDKGRCPIISLPIEPSDIKGVHDEIQKLIDAVWSGNFLESSCDDEECPFCALRRMM